MIRQFVPEKVCLSCRGCCRFSEPASLWSPTLLSEEIQELISRKIPPLLISQEKKLRLLGGEGKEKYVCPFLEASENTCKIYAFRPLECQLYPFLLNRKHDGIYLALDPQCPYASEHLRSKDLKEYVRYLSEALNSSPYIGSIRRNPHILQTYPGVLDLLKIED